MADDVAEAAGVGAAMIEPAFREHHKHTAEDLLVGLCGFVTSLITAAILWWVEDKFGLAIYSWMHWFVIPTGALLSGFAGASGYFFGSWFFGHRPTRLLLLNVVLASLATFFTVHYLSYITLNIDGKQVSDYISFSRYLDIETRSMAMEVRLGRGAVKAGSTGELGGFGYVIALLQVIGFSVGGVAVWGYLESKPYCEHCSRYLSAKGKQVRYTGDPEGLKAVTAQIFDHIKTDAIAAAIEQQRTFGNQRHQKDDHLRSVFEIRHCKKCGRHWAQFSIEKRSGDGWKTIPELTVGGFTDAVVNL